jgi:hypothetical protein
MPKHRFTHERGTAGTGNRQIAQCSGIRCDDNI